MEQARRLLHDDTLEPEDRVAGLLVLLYAQWPATISQLTLSHVQASGGQVRIRLGREPVVLPEPLDALVLQVVATRRGHAAIGDQGTSPWLFPGGQPGRPISASRLGERLREIGIHSGQSRGRAVPARHRAPRRRARPDARHPHHGAVGLQRARPETGRLRSRRQPPQQASQRRSRPNLRGIQTVAIPATSPEKVHDTTIREAFDRYQAQRINITGQRIGYDPDAPAASAEWVKHNLNRVRDSLPNGYAPARPSRTARTPTPA